MPKSGKGKKKAKAITKDRFIPKVEPLSFIHPVVVLAR